MIQDNKLDDQFVRELLTNLKLSENKLWYQVKDDVHHTIMTTDVPSISYLILNNKKGSDLIQAWDVNVAFGDVFTAAVKIDRSQINELVLTSYKTRYQISDVDKKINFKVSKYYQPYDHKKAIVAFLDSQRVFKIIQKYIVHFNKTNNNYWVPSILAEIDSDNNISYSNNFDFNGQTLISRIGDRTNYIHDGINNFETNHVNFLNSDLSIKLIIGLVEQNILVQIPTDDSPRQITNANEYTNLKKSELDGSPLIVKVFKDVRNESGEIIKYAIWNEIKKIGYLNRFRFNSEKHNFNFENNKDIIDEEAWKLIKDLPDGIILINDLKY